MVRPIASQWYRALIPGLTCALTASCNVFYALAHDDRPIPSDIKQVAVLREAVAPALLPLIDGAGLFRYPVPNVAAGDMPFDTALVQAAEFLFYAQNTWWRLIAESERGAFIEMGKLHQCGQPRLVRSKYEPPPDTVHRAFQNRLGDQWSIAFCGAYKGPEVVVTVAARRNESRYRDGRVLGAPNDAGAAFVVRGLPWWWEIEHFVTPEEAVNEVFAQTGVRARELPEMLRGENLGAERINGRPYSAHVVCAVWRVALERPVRVATRYTNRVLELSEVFVADSDCPGPVGQTVLTTPWQEQPMTREYMLDVPDSTATFGSRREVRVVQLRVPVEFETVIVQR